MAYLASICSPLGSAFPEMKAADTSDWSEQLPSYPQEHFEAFQGYNIQKIKQLEPAPYNEYFEQEHYINPLFHETCDNYLPPTPESDGPIVSYLLGGWCMVVETHGCGHPFDSRGRDIDRIDKVRNQVKWTERASLQCRGSIRGRYVTINLRKKRAWKRRHTAA